MVDKPPRSAWLRLIETALAEDLGPGDATSNAVIPRELTGAARIEAREPLVAAGLFVAAEVCERTGAQCRPLVEDGAHLERGAVMARIEGPARAILAAERTALNFLQRLSGIATLTHHYCLAIRGSRAQIVDTRKTTPGWRSLEKYAVRCGGGANHRIGLFDGILIKDNHIRAVGGVAAAVKRALEHGSPHLRIRVEVESLQEAQAAIDAGADAILIDNQTPDSTRAIVEAAAGRVRTEASGGITLDSIAAVAQTGVDEISVGALTHSARAVDIALEWDAS